MLAFEFPIILGWDAAGIIVETGEKVTEYKVGDRVFVRPKLTRQGTYAEYIAVEEHLLAAMPEKMSFEEGAAIPLAGLTAWECLVDVGKVKKGDKVLVHAGAGGVGTHAIQIAKSFGAYVATTASGEHDKLLKSLGADWVIDYKKEEFDKIVEDFDLVLDSLGDDIQYKSFSVLKKGGMLVSIAQPPAEEDALKYGVKTEYVFLEPEGKKLKKLAELFENGQLKPVIGEIFGFSTQGLKDAHALSETHHARGKIIVKIK